MALEDMDLDELCINTIRTLSIDAVHAADSGHPGAPLGCAAIAYTLWSRLLRYNPEEPDWPDRDRFVLSAGHASALLYSVLHLAGHDLPLEEIKNFRQLGSMTPGHPEGDCAPGVEVTTGPLGQGMGNAVGLAIAERYLAERFNRPGHELVNHRTFVLASDGDMMEGISHEAGSLAGHLGLGRLIVLYDDNQISLEGPTAEWFTDDTAGRFESYGWHICHVEDATTDVDAIAAAIEQAVAVEEAPSLIVCRTHIGYASPVQDTHKAHGAPLDAEQMRETKRNLGWPEDEHFLVPDRVREHFAQLAEKGREECRKWHQDFERYAGEYPDEAARWRTARAGELPDGWEADLPRFEPEDGPVATRSAAGDALEAIRNACWSLIGGCADLGSSTRTLPADGVSMDTGKFGSQNIRFGVREHLMAAACNGIERHGGLRAYGSTFGVFSDYCRPSLRLAGLMEVGTVYQFTHDSIGVGEDGPTHQPVEHLAALRAIPHWTVIRPADANEAREAWRCAVLNGNGPTAIMCSRQKLPVLDRTAYPPAEEAAKGAYVLTNPEHGRPDIILMASGSEVHPMLEAAARLEQDGVRVRTVSFPSWELFERQPEEYKRSVISPHVKARLAIEAGVPLGWHRYVGDEGALVALDRFGACGPGGEVMESLGFNVSNIVQKARKLLQKR